MAARFLPLIVPTRHGSRSFMTCRYKCGDACSQPEPNPTDHPYIGEVIETALARRSVLKGALGGAGVLVLGHAAPATAVAGPASGQRPAPTLATDAFTPVEPNLRDAVVVPPGYTYDVVIRWGDPVLADAPAFDVGAQTAESAAVQFGYNCDYVGVLPLDQRRALLVANHEFTNEPLMFPAGTASDTVKRVAIESHGMSVVLVQRTGDAVSGGWKTVDPADSRYNRRITGNTPFLIDGPAAGHERMKTSADPTGTRALGTLNNCAGGMTPWGTVLSGEENFNFYFDLNGPLDTRYTTSYARYALNGSRGRGWSEVDPRFELSTEPHEPFRFGWVVELDPYDPTSTPRKHTMLGRFKHEGANVVVADNGHVAAYMGDDESGDYVYKFVSADRFDSGTGASARAHNKELLTRGTLYVARFTDEAVDPAPEYDGVGEWIPLASDTTSYVDGMSVADVLIDTRHAADKVAPTRMDRPEDIEPNPANGRVYCALTNNSNRGGKYPVDEANPLAASQVRSTLGAPLADARGNRNGYVLELVEDGGDATATTFGWNLMLVCGDPAAPETYFAGYPGESVSPISCPDNVAFDTLGNLWIGTDGNALGSNDGLFRVPVAGPERGRVTQFLTVPIGAETCGPLITDGDRTAWVAVQHPGEVDGATFENQVSTWPHSDGFPRPSVIVAHRARP